MLKLGFFFRRAVCTAVFLTACGTKTTAPAKVTKEPLAPQTRLEEPPDPKPQPAPGTLLIRGATVLTAAGEQHAPGFVLIKDGRIAEVGAGNGPNVGDVLDATGMFLTPGIIDTHSHLGVYPYPSADAHMDGNEMVSPNTAEVWSEHGFWPQDPGLPRALAGGVTTIQVLPGSGNLVGGRGFTAKLLPRASARLMRFPNSPQGLKMACGENPKRVYGGKGRSPMTRMGNIAGYRTAFQQARDYRRQLVKHQRDMDAWRKKQEDPDAKKEDPPEPPARNFQAETLAKVLDGEILLHVHCYRADEMHILLDLARQYGFKIRSFHHGLEAYKLRQRLSEEEVAVSTWADWWGFKLEAYDGVPQNAAMLSQGGVRTIIHSDSAEDIRILNQEAAKAMVAGRKVGIDISEDEALRWITLNPAWALGIDQETGSIEVGKAADLVLWDKHPLSVYALAQKVFIDGHLAYDRLQGRRPSDFELGQPTAAPQAHETRPERGARP